MKRNEQKHLVEQKLIARLALWSNRDIYFDDVYRTLVQTGVAFICRDDIFEMKQRLKQLGISLDSLEIHSSYGGYFLSFKKAGYSKKHGNSKTIRLS
jgi:geranylgeranyl pyrophosphate synthase